MNRQICRFLAMIGVMTTALSGCHPTQPFYLLENGDLSYYLQEATEIEHPDVNEPRLAEVENAQAPFTLSDPFQTGCFWDLALEDAVAIALNNSKVIRSSASVFGAIDGRSVAPDSLIASPQPESSTTVYDAALVESNPVTGVEGALAAFDAQLSSGLFWSRADRPLRANATVGPFINLERDDVAFNLELSKRSATGTQLFFRNVTNYDYNSTPGAALPVSAYTTALELEARQPLLRGRGTQINRIPVVLARINHDISLADFEANVRNLVMDVERTYWDLHCRFRVLQATKEARDRALETWQDVQAEIEQDVESGIVSLQQGGGRTAEDELRARAQYFSFRAQVEQALRDLYNVENRLRFLMGLAATDGRFIRPIDDATTSRICFDWYEIHCEALIRSAELRRQKWVIQQREMELIASRNNLLPDLNVTALYRFVGVGDELISSNRNGLNFPAAGSTAVESLTEGRFQEFQLGFDFGMPVGYRRELAGVRNSELSLARERARLQDMELNVSHLLSHSVRDLDGLITLAESNFNQLAATQAEIDALLEKQVAGEDVNVDFILRAYQRSVNAEVAYYQTICDYNKAIAQVHYRKGSLLEYNNICLAEGPWPKKAYWDALGHARRRSASLYLDYGWSRPHVFSQGEVPQHIGSAQGHPTGRPNVVGPESIETPTPSRTAPGTSPPPLPMPEPVPARVRGGRQQVPFNARASATISDQPEARVALSNEDTNVLRDSGFVAAKRRPASEPVIDYGVRQASHVELPAVLKAAPKPVRGNGLRTPQVDRNTNPLR